jgi:hypothetical protein
MRDRDQHLVERFLGYRGNVEKRETMEFLVQFTDEETPIWKRYDQDLADTMAFENYCTSLPQLEPLLDTAAKAAKVKTELLRTRVDTSHQTGDVIYVDLRNRVLFEHEYYNSFDLDQKDIKPRYVRMVVGKPARVPGAKEGTRVELIDETFGLVHIASAHLLRYNGTLHFEKDLPANSEIITQDFALAHPYKPINEFQHRPIKAEDLPNRLNAVNILPHADTFRVCSWNINSWNSATEKGLLEHLQSMAGGAPEILLLQETKVRQEEENTLEQRLNTLGYLHVKLISSEQHQFGGVLIASKHPFTCFGASYSAPRERYRLDEGGYAGQHGTYALLR